MNTYFIAYPVTPEMGLRESIDAMLEHVAYNRHDFGYLPSAIHQANFEGLLVDYGAVLDDYRGVLVLKSRVEDSATLVLLVESLLDMCNDYPAYDDERVWEIEGERLVEMLDETRDEDHPLAEDLARALYEIGAHVEQSEYGANVSEEDYNSAVAYIRREETKELARKNGQTELF